MKKVVLEILEKAVIGELKLEDFYKNWPSEVVDENNFYAFIYEDLENAIEHFPGNLLSKKPNYEVWHGMEEYYMLIVDKTLLDLKIEDTQILIDLREKLILKKVSIGILQDEIEIFFKNRNIGF